MDPHADRHAIEALLVSYATALDARDWAGFASLFTPEATLDYTSSNGPRCTVDEAVAWLQASMALFASTQHLIVNAVVVLDGDEARATCALINPLVPAGDGDVLLVTGRYADRVRRTAEGWRFTERVLTVVSMTTLPQVPGWRGAQPS